MMAQLEEEDAVLRIVIFGSGHAEEARALCMSSICGLIPVLHVND